MDLFKEIIDSKDELYRLAIEYCNNANVEDYDQNKIDLFINKSISMVIDHLFIPTPCIEIKIDMHDSIEEKCIGSYILYVNNKKEFVDEFLIFS